MITLLTALVVAQTLPKGTQFEYSGLPSVDAGPAVHILSHDIRFALDHGVWQASSVTLFKSDSDNPILAKLTIPRWIAAYTKEGPVLASTFGPNVTWSNHTINLKSGAKQLLPDKVGGVLYAPLVAKVPFSAQATIALRVNWTAPTGVTGYAQGAKILGYKFPKNATIPATNISFSYSQDKVFNLPTLSPSWTWQKSATGTFVRLGTKTFDDDLVYFAYFPATF